MGQTLSPTHGLTVDIVRHPRNGSVERWQLRDQPDLFTNGQPSKPFVVLPKRWVVERTHAWIERARRLIMHHHRRNDVFEARVWLARGRQLMRRLTRDIL